jgi:hypothetical protein
MHVEHIVNLKLRTPFRPKVPFFRPKVPFFRLKVPFCRRVQFSMFVPLLETPKKALVHCTKPKIFPRKNPAFFANGKDMESYFQMPGKRILALELALASPAVCVLFQRLHPPFQKPWIHPCTDHRHLIFGQ